jgi:hypothetical protein
LIVLGVSAVTLSACQHAADQRSAPAGGSPASPATAAKAVDAFLYDKRDAAAVCSARWSPSTKSTCIRVVRNVRLALARHRIVLPRRGTMSYRLAGVQGRVVSIAAGNQQPTPQAGAPSFYGVFRLQRGGGAWRILRVDP